MVEAQRAEGAETEPGCIGLWAGSANPVDRWLMAGVAFFETLTPRSWMLSFLRLCKIVLALLEWAGLVFFCVKGGLWVYGFVGKFTLAEVWGFLMYWAAWGCLLFLMWFLVGF